MAKRSTEMPACRRCGGTMKKIASGRRPQRMVVVDGVPHISGNYCWKNYRCKNGHLYIDRRDLPLAVGTAVAPED